MAIEQKEYGMRAAIFIIVLAVIMKNTMVARRAEQVQPARDWNTFDLPNGQVVYRGRFYFAWSRGRFVGAYNSLDDAVDSLSLWEQKETLN